MNIAQLESEFDIARTLRARFPSTDHPGFPAMPTRLALYLETEAGYCLDKPEVE
jgi:hypothetical protein